MDRFTRVLPWRRLGTLALAALGFGYGLFTIFQVMRGAWWAQPADFYVALAVVIVLGLVCDWEEGRFRLAPEKEALVVLILVAIAIKDSRWDWSQLVTIWLSPFFVAWPFARDPVAIWRAHRTPPPGALKLLSTVISRLPPRSGSSVPSCQ